MDVTGGGIRGLAGGGLLISLPHVYSKGIEWSRGWVKIVLVCETRSSFWFIVPFYA